MATWRGGAALVILGLCLFLPGLRAMPPVDRDESRFAQASRQMLASGTLDGWIVPRVGDKPRLNKPPLIYWAQAASAWLLGERDGESRDARTGGVWRFRVPSVLCAIGSALITWRIGLAMFGRRGRGAEAALLVATMLLVCPLLAWDGRQARADQLLLVITLAATWALWRLWGEDQRAVGARRLPLDLVIGFWVAVALGIMTKGPVTPMVAGLTALALCAMSRRWRFLLRLRPGIGAVIVLLIVGPWVVLVARRVGWDEYWREVFDEVIVRSASAREGHWGPPGYHTVMLAVMFWPGSLMVFRGVVAVVRGASAGPGAVEQPSGMLARISAWWRGTADGGNVERFLMAWILPSWIVFEVVGTKLPHYVMPIDPGLALVAARQVVGLVPRNLTEDVGRWRRAVVLWRVAWVSIGLTLVVVGPLFLALAAGFKGSMGSMVALVALVAAAAAMMIGSARALLWKEDVRTAQWLGVGAAACGLVASMSVVVPRLDEPWVSSKIAAALREADPTGTRPIAAIEYHEDSLVFLTGGRVEKIGGAQGAEWLKAHATGLLVAPHDSPAVVGADDVARIDGLNYSKGGRVELVLVENSPPAPGK